jgi:hypothetical protein
MTVQDRFAEVVRHRSELATAMQRVEVAAAAPVGKESWVTDLRESLQQLEIAWDHHRIEMQTPTGLLQRVTDEAPRLQRAVSDMRDEQMGIATTITAAIEMVTAAGAEADPDPLREAAIEIFVAVSRHRQRGADILYEAFDVDIGGY